MKYVTVERDDADVTSIRLEAYNGAGTVKVYRQEVSAVIWDAGGNDRIVYLRDIADRTLTAYAIGCCEG